MQNRLGTFLGVYTPTILTILGVIMYLRFGWLVGQLGLSRVLLVVMIANAITLITTLSFSAVATNARVGVGGAYYIVSRSLGLEIGGSIGVPLFLSQAFSVTLYAFGLAESFRFVSPQLPLATTACVVIVAVSVLALLGAKYALKSQVFLMGLVAISLLALATGAILHSRDGAEFARATGEIGFWAGFAVFFPAVTGVMAGLGLSGDLADSGRSIPRGSILAVLTGLAVYLVVPVLLAIGADAATLVEDPLVWSKIAAGGGWLILPGLWAAIFSSAVGSMLGAPRTLQALARDGLAPRFFARNTGSDADLMPGMVLTAAIAVGAVFLGGLNAVASVVTMFFLTVYGTMNLVAAFEQLSGDPSWRPRLRVPWPVALLGGLGCAATMFLIDPLTGTIAVVAEFALWAVLSRRGEKERWGDARRGLYESLIRWALVKLSARPLSARSWRPHVLVFVRGTALEIELVRLGNWLAQGRGVVTVCELIVGSIEEHAETRQQRREEMRDSLADEELVAFPEVDVVSGVVDGIVSVAQSNGLAGLSSNTILLGWPDDLALRVKFLRALRALETLNKSILIGRIDQDPLASRRPLIHVWWGGLQRNGDLMLLLSWLLTRNAEWRDARVEVLSLASTEVARNHTAAYLARLIPEIRIRAEVRVIDKPKDRSVAEVIQETSADASLVFLGLATPDEGAEQDYAERLAKLIGELPNVILVKNSSLFIGELLESSSAEEADESPQPEDAGPKEAPTT